MGQFTEFVKQKLEEDTSAKQVSSNLLKNIIDVIKEYVVTEFDLSEDEKMQIINNMTCLTININNNTKTWKFNSHYVTLMKIYLPSLDKALSLV